MSYFNELMKFKRYIKLNNDGDTLNELKKNCEDYISSMIDTKLTEKKELTNLLLYLKTELEKTENSYLKRELIEQHNYILKKIELSEKEINNYKNILNI